MWHNLTLLCLCRVKPRVVVRKIPQREADSPVDPMKRKGESPSAGTRPSKKLKTTPAEFGLPGEEPEAHDAVPECYEDAPSSSEEGEDAELAAQKEKAAREERAGTKERRSKTRDDPSHAEATKPLERVDKTKPKNREEIKIPIPFKLVGMHEALEKNFDWIVPENPFDGNSKPKSVERGSSKIYIDEIQFLVEKTSGIDLAANYGVDASSFKNT